MKDLSKAVCGLVIRAVLLVLPVLLLAALYQYLF